MSSDQFMIRTCARICRGEPREQIKQLREWINKIEGATFDIQGEKNKLREYIFILRELMKKHISLAVFVSTMTHKGT